MEIPDYKVATSTTIEVDDSNTTDVDDADEKGKNINTEEKEEYSELYFIQMTMN